MGIAKQTVAELNFCGGLLFSFFHIMSLLLKHSDTHLFWCIGIGEDEDYLKRYLTNLYGGPVTDNIGTVGNFQLRNTGSVKIETAGMIHIDERSRENSI